jgi:predicted HD superfamily hydrolase involved in NAD metabolism
MHPLLESFTEGVRWTGDIRADMTALLIHHDKAQTVGHCVRVAAEAKRLARHFGQDESRAELASWLHDISAVVPLDERVSLARQLGLEILPEEAAAPMIIHQKLSAVIAWEILGVADAAVLSAIGCHTTLKADASALDKVVFVADKIAWDGSGEPPYLADLLAALERSLDQAAACYLDYLWQRRDTIPVVHPWFVAAHHQLAGAAGQSVG